MVAMVGQGALMAGLLTADDIDRELAGLPGWQAEGGSLHASYQAPDFATAVAVLDEVAKAADELDHHPDVDLRWRTLRFALSTHSEGGLTPLDVQLAHRITALATGAGSTAVTPLLRRTTIGIDCVDAEAIRPFWREAFGYDEKPDPEGDLELVDPTGRNPTIWFQPMDPPRTDRNRIHLDVYVQPSEAEGLRDRILTAGGRLVTDEHAPSWWVLADAEGNELCVCTSDSPSEHRP